MSTSSLFEVHTLKGGKWVIDSTYSDKDSAIEVAKQLYGEKRFEAIKVVKDTFNAKTGQGKEIVVFDTSKAPKEKTPPPPPPGKSEAPAAPPPSAAERPAAKPKASAMKKDMSVAVKAVAMLALILVVGGGLLVLVNQVGTLLD